MNLAWVDVVIIGIIAVSALVSVIRGFLKEVISLLTWIAAFWVAVSFSAQLAGWVPASIETPSVRLAIAFVALFLLTLVVGAVINYIISTVMDKSGLTGTDRMIGFVFGALRGVVVITVLVLFAGLTPLPQDPWWQESSLLPYFQSLATWTLDLLPADIARHFEF